MQVFRAKGGKLLIWGKKPKVIEATYFTGDGKKKKSLLLASGKSPVYLALHLQELESQQPSSFSCFETANEL